MADTPPQSDFGRFLSEMKRRHVVRFSIAYAAAAFIILQLVAEVIFPAFGIGDVGLRITMAVIVLGFLPAVVLAWIYDITKEGIRRTEEGPGRGTTYRIALAMFALTTIGVTGALGWYLHRQGVFTDTGPTDTALAYDASQPIRSLVVLPLDDFSPERDQGYIASGMHDEIIAQLSTIEGVRVVSRTTSMRYQSTTETVPEIGRDLGVDVVVAGSVLKTGDQIRITLQIIHAATDSTIETLQIDGTADDLLGLQEEAAQRVATVIGSTYERGELGLTAQDVPRGALDAYYQAMYEMDRRTPEATDRALQLFGEASRLAPTFAEAVAGGAAARVRLALRSPPDERTQLLDRAERDAARAFALDSTSMAVREVYDGIRVARRRGETLVARGRGDQAEDALWLATSTTLGQEVRESLRDTATAADPGSQLTFEARIMMSSGGFAEAATLLDSIVVVYPQTQEAWDQLLRARVTLEQLDQAVSVVLRWNAAGAPGAPGPRSLEELRAAIEREGARGYWTWRRDYLLAQRDAGNPIVLADLAAAYAGTGDRTQAYAYLDQALEAGESRIYAIPNDPTWDPLRRDRRFQQIEEEVQRRRRDLSVTVGATESTPQN